MTSNVATQILSIHTEALFGAAVRRAAELLRAGELVILPTETVYGLAANALEPAAVKRVFEVKGRPAHNPVIVHVAGIDMARRCVSEWPSAAERLAASFWPGPLTLVLKRSRLIPEIVTGGGETVGVRWPRHPFIQALIRECGFPLAAPSANAATEVSPTTAEHARKALNGKIPLIVDGGPCQVGIESTVLDLTADSPQVLRPGMIRTESLLAALGKTAGTEQGNGQRDLPASSSVGAVPRSPGLLNKHYAPKAKLIVLPWSSDAELARELERLDFAVSEAHVIAHTNVPSGGSFGSVSIIPHDSEAFARALYAELHRCDEAGARLIVMEQVPETPEWHAIADRLARAAG